MPSPRCAATIGKAICICKCCVDKSPDRGQCFGDGRQEREEAGPRRKTMPEAADTRAVPDAATLAARAAAMRDTLRARAQACEDARTVSDETMQALRAAGLFRILQPRRFGGYELDFAALIGAITEISRGCGSTGWVYMIGGIHQWLVAEFPLEAQQEVWGRDPDTTVSGSYAPSATAKAVPGGYRVSGLWGFASGCDHAGWHVAGV